MGKEWPRIEWERVNLDLFDPESGIEEIIDDLNDGSRNNGGGRHDAGAQAKTNGAGAAPDPAQGLPTDSWPKLAPEAFYGLAGDVVAALAPHTEADPLALLMQFMVYFGNCIGRGPHMLLDGTKHFSNLFTVIAGATAKSRKGTSAERIRRIFDVVDQDWTVGRITGGLSSGEGVIWTVRDPILEFNKKTGTNDITDPGVVDKRLLLDEREFYQALAVQRREGNTLSVVLRDAWDGRDVLQTLTKHSRGRATEALVSIVGHITIEELREMLDPMAMRNGFVNRFLFVCARRGKLLPRGNGEADIRGLVERTTKAVTAARGIASMEWTERSGPMWDEAYLTKLSLDRPGLFGAITARSEPQTARLAMLYALLDGSLRVRCRHLKAALALWDYCDASARFIFGSLTGDPIADAILRELRSAGSSGLKRTAIRDLFGRHAAAEKIETALQKLLAAGKVRCEKQAPSSGAGRPSEVWFATGEGK
jgi:hypothetical protein